MTSIEYQFCAKPRPLASMPPQAQSRALVTRFFYFAGDFRQVLHVLPRKTQPEAMGASIVSSYLWPKLIKFHLTVNSSATADLVLFEIFVESWQWMFVDRREWLCYDASTVNTKTFT